MGEEELYKVIETNFRLLSLTNREVAGGMRDLATDVHARMNALATRVDEQAGRLDETLEALKTLAFREAS